MKHKIGFNSLSRTKTHRKAMIRNMMTSLFRYERVTTTKAKALEVRRHAEKVITRAKVDSVHNRRVVAEDIKDKEILAKLFTDIAVRNSERPGGYTRIIKLGQRSGDAADMVLLELVERQVEESEEPKKKKNKKKEQPSEKKAAAEAEVTAEAEEPSEK